MQQFGNFAYDFSDKSFPDYSLGAGLLDKVFSENEVRKMSSSSEPLEEIKRAFSKLIPFEQEEFSGFDLSNVKLFANGSIMRELPEVYYRSASFQAGETRPPFEMLEKYVHELARTEGVLPRVGRAEMYERERFVVDFSEYLFESHSNIGAICFYGSFIRGRKNPHDIDVAIFLKEIHPFFLIRDETYCREGVKSEKLKSSRGLECFRPAPSALKSFTDMDDVYFLIENYQNCETHLFLEMADNNTYGEEEKRDFRINAIVMPYELDFSTQRISGGHIWVINSKNGDNYKSFFSLGEEFRGEVECRSYLIKTHVP